LAGLLGNRAQLGRISWAPRGPALAPRDKRQPPTRIAGLPRCLAARLRTATPRPWPRHGLAVIGRDLVGPIARRHWHAVSGLHSGVSGPVSGVGPVGVRFETPSAPNPVNVWGDRR